MNDMESPEQHYTIVINHDETKDPLTEMHIDYFDQFELIKALQMGIKTLGLEERIIISVSRKLFGHEPSEWATSK